MIRASNNDIILDIYNDEIKPQAKSGESTNNLGPGCKPHIIKPPRSTAVVPLPGIPSAKSGPKAPAAAPLFAASDAAIPSIAPVPRGSLFLDFFWIV